MAIIATSSRSYLFSSETTLTLTFFLKLCVSNSQSHNTLKDPRSAFRSDLNRRTLATQTASEKQLGTVGSRSEIEAGTVSETSRFNAAILPLGASISIFSEKAKPIAKRGGSRRNASFPAPIALIPGIRFISPTFYLQYSYIMIRFHSQFHIQFQTSSHLMMQ
ncbi:hypothetical protein LXL04_029155 [Taraxacum kok-saghyz]